MSGLNSPRKIQGVASAVTILIITAVTTAMMAAIGSTIVTLIQETMPRENIPAIVMQEGQEKKVELINPSMVSVNLSKLEVLVDSSRIKIEDENKDGTWAPGEKIWFTLPDKDFAVVEVYYDTKLIYKAAFFRPLPIYHDVSFPFISVDDHTVTVTDDTAVIALNIYAGFENEEKLIYSTATMDVSTARNCYDEFRKRGVWLCEGLSEFSLNYNVDYEQNTTNKTIRIQGTTVVTNQQIYYLRFVVYDITGKPSSIVTTLSSTPYIYIDKIEGGAKTDRLSETTWRVRTNTSSTSVLVRASAIDDNGLKEINISASTSQLCSVSGRNAFCEKSFSLSIGQYTVLATAVDITDLSSTARADLIILEDRPPSVAISEPNNGTTFNNANIRVSVSASDDFNLTSIEILHRGNSVAVCQASGTSGTCSANITLVQGSNSITAIATDDIGQQSTATINVSYSPPAPTPTPTPTPSPEPTPTPSPTPPPIIFDQIALVYVPEVNWAKELEDVNIITS